MGFVLVSIALVVLALGIIYYLRQPKPEPPSPAVTSLAPIRLAKTDAVGQLNGHPTGARRGDLKGQLVAFRASRGRRAFGVVERGRYRLRVRQPDGSRRHPWRRDVTVV
ncbi:MAG: hypothetical protein HY220_02350 [Candidatus Sungbacteria bacterium]|uniref:Uncharacterized protein n=1 Tax=Candidatus Sungiibacteriota bacterium TaxID=2750080 RepID=A0A9D6QVK6_9BACT|nr:hypothetical protein [Candidatus Sungbacteria bacterium]